MERLARTTTPSLDKRKTIKFEKNGFQKASFLSASNSSLCCVIQCGSLCLESLTIALVLLMLWPLTQSLLLCWPPAIKLLLLILHNSNLATAMNHNGNIFGDKGMPMGSWNTGWEPLYPRTHEPYEHLSVSRSLNRQVLGQPRMKIF